MAQQQQEVAASAKSQKAKAQANAQLAMMSELKSRVSNSRPKDSRKIGKDEIYHGALEDILTGKITVINILCRGEIHSDQYIVCCGRIHSDQYTVCHSGIRCGQYTVSQRNTLWSVYCAVAEYAVISMQYCHGIHHDQFISA